MKRLKLLFISVILCNILFTNSAFSLQLPLRGSNVSSINVSNLNQNCVRLIDDTRKYTFKILEKGFPYHYTIGLFQTETNCRWLISRDGVGSIGYAQITPSMWDRYLLPYAPNYKVKDHPDHIIATKILLKHYMQRNTCNKLWITYQIHNGGFLILRECKRANSCEWKDCKNNCRRRDVCVLFDNTTKTCKQFRNACEITYSYSQKVHQYGLRYKNYIETKYKDKFDNKKYTYW